MAYIYDNLTFTLHRVYVVKKIHGTEKIIAKNSLQIFYRLIYDRLGSLLKSKLLSDVKFPHYI